MEFKQVKETPFTLAKQNEEWYILLGKYRLSEGYETEKEAEKEANTLKMSKNVRKITNIRDDNLYRY